MNYIYRWGTLLFAVLTLVSVATASHRVIHLRQLGLYPGEGSSSADWARVLDELRADTSDSLTLVLEPGVYSFARGGAVKKQVYISNHDQLSEPRAFALLFEGRKHLVIDGMGARLLMRDNILPIGIIGCEQVELRNLTIDFISPTIVQSSIVSNHGAKGVTIRPIEGTRGRINPQGRWEAFGNDWVSTLGTGIAFDATTRHTLYRVSDLDYSTEGAELRANGDIYLPRWVDERLPQGTVVAMRSYARPNPAIFVDDSRDVTLRHITIHYADGMGVLAQNSHNLTLMRVDVRPAPGRYFSTQADATHFSGCSGHIEVTDGHFEAMMDDAINVHGVYLRLSKRLDDYTLIGRYMHEQAWGFEWGRVGDMVRFVASRTFDIVLGVYTIKSIEPYDNPTTAGAKVFKIRFAERLPRQVRPELSIGLENMRKIPSVTFAHNRITNNRARGTLFNTSRLVRVEYNHFDNISGSGVLVSSDCNMWFESGQTNNMIVRGNVFEDLLTSLYQFTEAVISINPVIPELAKQREPFYGQDGGRIVIEDNLFKTFDTPLLYAQSVQGLVWRRNRVVPTTTHPKYHPNQQPYKLEGCRNIRIEEE